MGGWVPGWLGGWKKLELRLISVQAQLCRRLSRGWAEVMKLSFMSAPSSAKYFLIVQDRFNLFGTVKAACHCIEIETSQVCGIYNEKLSDTLSLYDPLWGGGKNREYFYSTLYILEENFEDCMRVSRSFLPSVILLLFLL